MNNGGSAGRGADRRNNPHNNMANMCNMPDEYNIPDERGFFGPYGGRFVPETVMTALFELKREYDKARLDPAFQEELAGLLREYSGRPTPLYYAERLSRELDIERIYLKREDLNHTGAHKINNALGQVLLARRMGKERIIAETGAGQHGVATATVAAKYGIKCDIYMGGEDIERQRLNVFRMRLLGARVIPVSAGSGTLKDATNEAIRDWVENVRNTHYIIGSAVGPDPYPRMVRDFQSVIGIEARGQFLEKEGVLPDMIVACVGGGSNAIGIFYPFIQDKGVGLVGVEAGGLGLESGKHAASISSGQKGVLHGALTYLMNDENGQVLGTHSISAGLDYPGVGPEHSYLNDIRRVEYSTVTDDEALQAFLMLSRVEGIIPALESSHALAYVIKNAKQLKNKRIIVNLSGRGDKDVVQVEERLRGRM